MNKMDKTTKNNPAAFQKVSPSRFLKIIKDTVQKVINGQNKAAINIFRAGLLNYFLKFKRKNQFYCNLCKCESPNFLHTSNENRILFNSPKILHFAPGPVFYKLFQNIDYESDSFDLISCNHVLEHVPNDYKALKELYRILKHSGIAIITVPGNWCIEKIIEYDYPDGNGHYRDYGLNFISVLDNIFTAIECIDLYKYNDIYHLALGLTPQHDLAFLCRKD